MAEGAPKKKSTTSTVRKKAKPTDSKESEPGSSEKKSSAASSLDLPLPAKTDSKDLENSSAEKKEPATSSTEAKSGEKSTPAPVAKREHAPNATVEPTDIVEFAAQPPRIQQLIRDALDLTRLNLTYTFGSDHPDKGGMDCSGTIYYLLRAHGFNDVARDSSGQYLWARKSGAFFPVLSKSADGVEFEQLLPGDLMFWTGTYATGRDVPISHVMLYLGREKESGQRIMFGASDGRSYHGVQRWGVSVFDFKMPKPDPANPEKARVDFVGFGRIPGLRNGGMPVAVAETPAVAAESPSATTSKSDTAAKPRSKGASAKGRKRE